MGNVLARLGDCRLRMKNLADVFEGRVPKVLILGLDAAGKTSLLYKANLDNTIYANVPPRGINIEHMRAKRGARIQLYDMPGSKISRHMWSSWYYNTEAIIYVVDSADKVRIDEAKFELHDLIQVRDLNRVPIIVAANKQDIQGAMDVDEVSAELELSMIENREVSVRPVSAQTGKGVNAIFAEAVDKIKELRTYRKTLGITGKPPPQKNTVADKRKKIEDFDNQTFTNIETASASSGSQGHSNVPSLFDSINKRSEVTTDLDADSDVIASTSTSSSDQPRYDRPNQDATDVPSHNSKHPDDFTPVPDDTSVHERDVELERISDSDVIDVGEKGKGKGPKRKEENSPNTLGLNGFKSTQSTADNAVCDSDSDLSDVDNDVQNGVHRIHENTQKGTHTATGKANDNELRNDTASEKTRPALKNGGVDIEPDSICDSDSEDGTALDSRPNKAKVIGFSSDVQVIGFSADVTVHSDVSGSDDSDSDKSMQ